MSATETKMKILLLFLFSINILFAVVDLNSADQKELITLNGIGAKKAEKILLFRKSHCFKTLDEITKVKGIGKKTLEKNRARMSVGACRK